MEALLARLSGLPHWEIMLLATGIFLEGLALTVFPEEVITSTLGLLWGLGRISFVECLCAVWFGLMPANFVMFTLGRKVGPNLLTRRPFRWVLSPEVVGLVLAPMKRHGRWVVFFTRFIPVVRAPIYFSAGLAGVMPRFFVLSDWLGSCIQVPALLLLGRSIGTNAGSLMQAYQKIGLIFAAVIVLTLVTQIVLTRVKPRRI